MSFLGNRSPTFQPSHILLGGTDARRDGGLRHIDWPMMAYVGMGLLNEALIRFQLPWTWSWRK